LVPASHSDSNLRRRLERQDAAADPHLLAAILLGLDLATRGRTVGDQGDLEALRDIEGRIKDELRYLDKMEKYNEGIRRNSDGIADEIRNAQRQLAPLQKKAKSTLTALNIEFHHAALERSTSISLLSSRTRQRLQHWAIIPGHLG